MILVRVDSERGVLSRYECTARLARLTRRFENGIAGLFTPADIEWFRADPPDEVKVLGTGLDLSKSPA